MSFDLLPALSTEYFSCKIQLFVTLKFGQALDPHGSGLVWLPRSGIESGSAIRIEIKSWVWICIETNTELNYIGECGVNE
jgi:hypothetical protein